MANFLQLSGEIQAVECLLNSLIVELCGQDTYEFEDLDDQGMIRVFYENMSAFNLQVLLTSLYYRLQDPLFAGVKPNMEIPAPNDSVFRITASAKTAQKVAEDFFIYNGIENYIDLVYPLSLDCTLAKVELIAVGLSEEELAKLNRQGKTTVLAGKVHNKIDKVGSAMQTTGRIVANDVINPLAVAASKTTATIVSAGAKTLVDCALAASNEVLRDVAQLSLSELKQRDDVKTMGYSIRKLMNKTQIASDNKNRINNFNL